MPDKPLKFLRSSVQVIMLSFLLAGGSVGFAYGQTADSDASAGAGASSGDGTSSADSDSSTSASAGPDGSGVTADSHGETSGSATGGDTSASEPGISADATATSGDTPTAATSTSAGTYATSTAGNYKSAYADGGTVYQKLGNRRGYAVSYQDGAYSAAYYHGDTASAFSGIYSDNNFTKKTARSIIRSEVRVGAYANRTEAAAWASAGTYAQGKVGRWASAAETGAHASAWANGSASAALASTRFSASFGKQKAKSRQLTLVRRFNDCGSTVRRSDRIKCSRRP